MLAKKILFFCFLLKSIAASSRKPILIEQQPTKKARTSLYQDSKADAATFDFKVREQFSQAVLDGNLEKAKRFVEMEGQNVNPLPQENAEQVKNNPLCMAMERNYFEIADYFIEKEEEIKKRFGAEVLDMLLIQSAKNILSGAVKRLIEEGKNVNQTDSNRKTLLRLVLEYIIENKKNPELKNKIEEAIELAIFLIENNADIKSGFDYKSVLVSGKRSKEFERSLSKIWELILELNIFSLSAAFFKKKAAKKLYLLQNKLREHKDSEEEPLYFRKIIGDEEPLYFKKIIGEAFKACRKISIELLTVNSKLIHSNTHSNEQKDASNNIKNIKEKNIELCEGIVKGFVTYHGDAISSLLKKMRKKNLEKYLISLN